jgi:hypothetical protein
MYVYRNIEHRSCNHCHNEKNRSITYSACVFAALVIQRAKRMSHFIMSSVACPDLQYFSVLSHKRYE